MKKLASLLTDLRTCAYLCLLHMHALLESDYAILTYILHFFALCRGPKWGGMAQYFHFIYVPGCACLNDRSILVTA